VILEYPDHSPGGGISIPPERLETLTLQTLADAFSNAAVLIVYEGRHRPQYSYLSAPDPVCRLLGRCDERGIQNHRRPDFAGPPSGVE
jgi:hypothetical protein